MLDPLTALSLASALVQLVDLSKKICTLIHKYSGLKGMPERLVDALSETEHKLQTSSSTYQQQSPIEGGENFNNSNMHQEG